MAKKAKPKKSPKVKRAVDIAREMGLPCDVEPTHDGKYVRFMFKLPDMNEPTPEGGVDGQPLVISAEIHKRRLKGEYLTAVALVTKFQARVKAWTFAPAPPGEKPGLYVAAELSLTAKAKVAAVNKRNRAALVKFWSGESMARNAALSQTDPRAALNALKEQLAKHGITKPDAETLKLQASFELAASIVEAPEPPVFGANQGAAEAVH